MREDLLPLFPLAVVLLPEGELPLHIFEERYKEMIGQVLDGRIEFGVVLATANGIVSTGCTASVLEVVKKYPDGRLDILTVGRRRFSISKLNEEKEYLRAAVEFFADNDQNAPMDLRENALRMCTRLPLAEGLPAREEFNVEDPQLSFQLAQRITDLQFRQQLLLSRSEADRLRMLVDYVPDFLERRQLADRLKELAPKNGHGKPPSSIQ